MRRRLPFLAVVAVLALAGCTGKPENSPYIRNKFAEFDDSRKSVERMNTELAALSADLKVISEQITELRALAPDSTGASEVIQRLNNLERRVAEMDGKAAPATLRTNNTTARSTTTADSPTISAVAGTADTPQTVSGLAVPAGASAPVDAVKGSQPKAEPQKAEPKKAEPKRGEAMKPGTKPAEPKGDSKVVQTKAPAGRYYIVQAGDTIASIAKAHGVSVEVLLKENRIPADARVPKGQRLFIPGAK